MRVSVIFGSCCVHGSDLVILLRSVSDLGILLRSVSDLGILLRSVSDLGILLRTRFRSWNLVAYAF